MGKKSKIILGLATAAMIPAILTGCGHEHEYGKELKSNDTQHWYECECGEKKDVENHEAATTYTPGDTHHWKDCSDCGYDLTIEQHNYNQEVATSDYLKTAATVTTKAVYYKSCVCGKAGTETFEADKTTATITNIVMSGKTYDGSAVAAPTFDKNSDGTAVVEYKVKTADDNTYTTTAPTNAGEYTVRVSVPETIEYTSTSATKDFTIAKATANLENVALPAIIVYGDDYDVNFLTNSNGVVTYEWYRGSLELSEKPTKAGNNYKVKVRVAETNNYTAVESELIDFAINPYILQGLTTQVEYNGTDTHIINLDSIVSGMELVVTFNDKGVGSQTTGVVVKINGDTTNNYTVDTTTCFVEIVQKEIGIQWIAPNDLRFDLTEKVPTVKATGLCGEDICDVTINLMGDNVWYGSKFTYEATDLSNSNYKLPSNKVSPEYTITIDETAGVDDVINIGAASLYADVDKPMYASVTLDEGVYYFDYTNGTQGVNFSFELYAKGDKTTQITSFNVTDQNKKSTAFNIEAEGEYYLKVVPDQETQGDELTIRMDTHAEVDEYGFCVHCGEYQGDTITAGEGVEVDLAVNKKAYYRIPYTYTHLYGRTFDAQTFLTGDFHFYVISNANGDFAAVNAINSKTPQDIGEFVPVDGYIYIVIYSTQSQIKGTFYMLDEHDINSYGFCNNSNCGYVGEEIDVEELYNVEVSATQSYFARFRVEDINDYFTIEVNDFEASAVKAYYKDEGVMKEIEDFATTPTNTYGDPEDGYIYVVITPDTTIDGSFTILKNPQ